jgi:hypothetical protein
MQPNRAVSIGAIIAVIIVIAAIMTAPLSFERKIQSSLDPTRLTLELHQAFRDSKDSNLWPNNLEISKSEKIANNASIWVEYQLGESKIQLEYIVYNYTETGFNYQPAKSHPLTGHVRIDITPYEGGSLLHWRGKYRPKYWEVRNIYLHYFIWRFFTDLEKNLRVIEHAEGKLINK